jgi:hypothetical protein
VRQGQALADILLHQKNGHALNLQRNK